MARADAITVEGDIVEVLPRMAYRVELSNGHRVLAHFRRRNPANSVVFAVGDRVLLELSPFDLSEGRIIVNEENV